MIKAFPTIAAVMLLAGCQSAPSSDAAEQEIRALLDRWQTAFEGRDVARVMSIYQPDANLIVYDFGPAAEQRGSDELRRDYARFFARFKGPLESDLRNLHVATEPTVAFSYAMQRVRGTSTDGSKVELWVRFTQGYRKVSGRWMVVHEHLSVPVDMRTGRARLDFRP